MDTGREVGTGKADGEARTGRPDGTDGEARTGRPDGTDGEVRTDPVGEDG